MTASDPGVAAPPAEPSAPAEPASPGNEPVINSDARASNDAQTVPFSRFQEVNDKAKASEEAARVAREELDAFKAQQNQPPQNDDDIEPDTLDLIKKSATKLGFVSRDELDAREARIQVQSDISELTSAYKDSGIPFDGKSIIEYAKANGMQITSRKSLDAIYKEMNYDAIIEAQRKSAITAFQEGAKSAGEKPGSKGAQPPQESKPESLKDRVKAARERLNISLT
jgi:type II secretory pathway pseudopilin PulG